MKSRVLILGTLLLSACGSTPVHGPGILVLPGSGKNFDQFRFDDHECRNYAQSLIAKGSDTDTAGSAQQRYDRAYLQCMYAKGHRIPITGRSDYMDSTSSAAARTPPPPPPGKPPAEAPPDFRPK